MPEITVYDREGNKACFEFVGHGIYEKIVHTEEGETVHTGDTINLRAALQCESYFTEEQHERFLARKARASKK